MLLKFSDIKKNTAFILVITITFLSSGLSVAESASWLQNLKKERTEKGWTFDVDDNDVLDIPLSERTGLQLPSDWKEKAVVVIPKEHYDMPAKFDYRDLAPEGLTSIKNQGNCGSCWAFASAGVFENVIRIRDGVEKDLSEQYLVSCNTLGYSCNGGWWAHDLHQQYGLVPEESFPYEASDLSCKQGLPHEEKITSWAFVTSQEDLPSVEALKNALYTYGPLAVTVVATDSFSAYRGGIFNDCSGGTSVNHAVVLVGWDDSNGEGHWIMRNSWGASWGENGYMRIKYGCNAIGYAASFVVYAPKCNPQPEANAGSNQTIKKGQSIKIGTAPIIDQTYGWSPTTGLNDPKSPQPLASPTVDTTYTLTVKTSCGTAINAVKVTVQP